MHPQLATILNAGAFVLDSDGVYSANLPLPSSGQEAERILREDVAAQQYKDYLKVIAQSHSIAVMDHEVDRFLAAMPIGALILDIGGCWGWHWRRLAETRPDVGVLIVDFVRANLTHARKVLGSLVGDQIALMHADATALPFHDASASYGFEGVWTVQVFQHIPDFRAPVAEAYRVIKPGGRFVNYSLYATPFNRMIYRLLGKPYHTTGMVNNIFHLTRANDSQRKIIGDIFGEQVFERYTECLFHPDIKLTFTGCERSWFGHIDARMGDHPWLGVWIARQRSFEVNKS